MAKRSQAARFGAAGTKLFTSITAAYEVEGPHEEALLAELCRVADVLADLQAQVDKDGCVVRKDFEGPPRPHPALIEARNQRTMFIRLVRALKLPSEVVEAPRPKVRHGVRELRAQMRAVGVDAQA
jgi:hypothetical protein